MERGRETQTANENEREREIGREGGRKGMGGGMGAYIRFPWLPKASLTQTRIYS